MNTQFVNKITTRMLPKTAAAVGLLLIFFTIHGFGQKEVFEARRATSRDGLMDTGYLTKGDISDDLDGTDEEYFYKFAAIPGKLTITVEITANETNAGATVDLIGANSKAILSNMLVQAANRGSERVTQSVNLSKSQDIIIRIKGLRYGSSAGYPGIYKIRLEGAAVNFKEASPTDGPLEVKKPDGAPSDGTDQNKNPNVPQSDGTGQDKKPDAAPTDGPDQAKKSNDAPSDGTAQSEKPAAAPSDKSGQNKKSDKVERVIDKATTKGQKWLDLIEKVKPKKP